MTTTIASPATTKPPTPTTTTHTLRSPSTYIHLTLLLPPAPLAAPTDTPTFLTHLQSALSTFLGLHGAAIPIDVLRTSGNDIWIRVPRQDGSAVVAACGGYVGGGNGEGVGWRVRGWGGWLGGLVGRGEGVFEG
ncbi:hypothetical protein K490DRAFT_67400 [Saccharata proteae CBS 121410]|uniref:Ribonucleases P/MRP subunit Pop8-like domain-containing protein n=1 Tax=Saccharata proteae CBS 121410 TaxID=1314787 RepID=A0A9P4LVB3_9PEZI|nr:hypothetical protein K490DRAFT_67400 [Saccharata proteae CBS 121410]